MPTPHQNCVAFARADKCSFISFMDKIETKQMSSLFFPFGNSVDKFWNDETAEDCLLMAYQNGDGQRRWRIDGVLPLRCKEILNLQPPTHGNRFFANIACNKLKKERKKKRRWIFSNGLKIIPNPLVFLLCVCFCCFKLFFRVRRQLDSMHCFGLIEIFLL